MEPDFREIFQFSEEDEASFGKPKIVVVGCGGAGNNTVSRLVRIGLEGARTVAINTDRQHLKMVEADKKILMGGNLTRGLGTGGDPEAGRKAAEQAVTKLDHLLDGADMVFVTAGMGGGTGTGSAPVVARLAKEKGAIVVAMVTTPFHIERTRVLVADEGLEALQAWADTLIVLDNNRLLDCAPDLTLKEAAAIAGALTQELDPKANVIWGAMIRPDFEGRVRLVAIITGVKSAQVLGPSEPGSEETPARIEVIK